MLMLRPTRRLISLPSAALQPGPTVDPWSIALFVYNLDTSSLLHWLAGEQQMATAAKAVQSGLVRQRCAFAASRLPPRGPRIACAGRGSGSEQAAVGGASAARRGLLQLLAGGLMLTAGVPGGRSVATAAAVDQAAQVGLWCMHAVQLCQHVDHQDLHGIKSSYPAWCHTCSLYFAGQAA